jgi:hypothetical protein
MRLKVFVIKLLIRLCGSIDAIAYRPAIVKATLWLPRWWCCHFAHVSMRLDDYWKLGYWDSEEAPPAPDGPCDACKRRAAWLTVGGLEQEEEPSEEATYLERHPVQLCGWCELRFHAPPKNGQELKKILKDAGARSIGWRWQ